MRKPENLFQFWWWIALCIILAASIGSLISTFLPVRYQKSADLQILFEYSGVFYWDDKDMQSLTRAIEDLIDSPQITQTVLSDLQEQGINLTEQEFERFTQKQQRHYGWRLIVTTNEQDLTEALINSWQTAVIEAVTQDIATRSDAQQQEKLMDAWISCIQQLPAEPTHSYCNFKNAASISYHMNIASDQYTADMSEVIFLKDFPVVYDVQLYEQEYTQIISLVTKSGAILIGGLLGMIFGVIMLEKPWIKHINFKQDEA